MPDATTNAEDLPAAEIDSPGVFPDDEEIEPVDDDEGSESSDDLPYDVDEGRDL
jgi:hypothetical protein